MSLNTNFRIRATARDAGRNVVHIVTLDGQPVGTRRSAHRYSYAICRWYRYEGTARLIVSRWSRNPKASGEHFAVKIEDS